MTCYKISINSCNVLFILCSLVKVRKYTYENKFVSWIYLQIVSCVLLQKRIKDHFYRSIDDLETDVMTLCKNAQAYNMEGSLVSLVQDTIFLQLRQREKHWSVLDSTFSHWLIKRIVIVISDLWRLHSVAVRVHQCTGTFRTGWKPPVPRSEWPGGRRSRGRRRWSRLAKETRPWTRQKGRLIFSPSKATFAMYPLAILCRVGSMLAFVENNVWFLSPLRSVSAEPRRIGPWSAMMKTRTWRKWATVRKTTRRMPRKP